MNKKEKVARFRLLVIAANCLLASLSLVNLYTIASGAVRVEIPEENDFAWTVDTKYDEATFLANFTVTNHGIYDIYDLDIHAIVRTEKDTQLIDYRQEDLTIPSGHERKFNIYAILPFEKIDTNEWRTLMLNDSVFYLDVDISANYLWGLGRFVVDDTLEYIWEAPLGKIGNKTDDHIVELFRYLVSENADLNGFMDMVIEDVVSSSFFDRFDWMDASLRLESWPQGNNVSKIIVRVTLDILNGRRTVMFELVMMLKQDGDGYEITKQDYRFDYW